MHSAANSGQIDRGMSPGLAAYPGPSCFLKTSSGQSQKVLFRSGRSTLITRRCNPVNHDFDTDSEAESDSDLNDRNPAKAYATPRKEYKDVRFKLLSEAALLALFLGGLWAKWGNSVWTCSGPGPPVLAGFNWVVLLSFWSPCYGHLQRMRKLGNRCKELLKALPSGYKALPLVWNSKDERHFWYNIDETLPMKVWAAGAMWVVFMTFGVSINALFPAATVEKMEKLYFAALCITLQAVGSILSPIIHILALKARKQESLRTDGSRKFAQLVLSLKQLEE